MTVSRLMFVAAAALAASALSACNARQVESDRGAAAPATTFVEANWTPKREADIPADSLGVSIRRGLAILRHTPDSLPAYATSGLNCTSCHQDDGIKPTAGPLTGSHARFPKYMPRSGTVIALADRVNYCFTRSLAGNAIPVGSREMTDILAYLAFISYDVPTGTKITGHDGLVSMQDTLVGDIARGEKLYVEKTCVACHQADGAGVDGAFPALWGAKSYSVGASMARAERAASFIWHNMPQTAPKSLTPQEAFDLSAYINSKPRPDSPGKEMDWPMGGAPKDVPYKTNGHEAFNPPPLLPRANPKGAVVPNPPVIGRGAR